MSSDGKKEGLELLGSPETVDVAGNPLVFLWIKEKAKREPLSFARLSEDNRKRLARLWGKGKKEGSGGLAWAVEELGIPLFVISGTKGTFYKVNYPGGEKAFASDRKMGSAITSFLEKLLAELSGYGGQGAGH